MTSETNILVVDTSANIRQAIKGILEKDGYQVITASNKTVAFELIRTHNFDLAVIDLGLKDMRGLDVLAYLGECSPNTIAIILTAHTSPATLAQAMRLGAQDYLFKPCQTIDLQRSITRALKARQQKNRQSNLFYSLEQTEIPVQFKQ